MPPVLIMVCDNTDIAEVFYRKISGEIEEDVVTEAEVAEVLGEEESGDGDAGGQRYAEEGEGGEAQEDT